MFAPFGQLAFGKGHSLAHSTNINVPAAMLDAKRYARSVADRVLPLFMEIKHRGPSTYPLLELVIQESPHNAE